VRSTLQPTFRKLCFEPITTHEIVTAVRAKYGRAIVQKYTPEPNSKLKEETTSFHFGVASGIYGLPSTQFEIVREIRELVSNIRISEIKERRPIEELERTVQAELNRGFKLLISTTHRVINNERVPCRKIPFYAEQYLLADLRARLPYLLPFAKLPFHRRLYISIVYDIVYTFENTAFVGPYHEYLRHLPSDPGKFLTDEHGNVGPVEQAKTEKQIEYLLNFLELAESLLPPMIESVRRINPTSS
jgi:hypothetical protein